MSFFENLVTEFDKTIIAIVNQNGLEIRKKRLPDIAY